MNKGTVNYVYVTRPDKNGERHLIKRLYPLPAVTQKLLRLTNLSQNITAKICGLRFRRQFIRRTAQLNGKLFGKALTLI